MLRLSATAGVANTSRVEIHDARVLLESVRLKMNLKDSRRELRDDHFGPRTADTANFERVALSGRGWKTCGPEARSRIERPSSRRRPNGPSNSKSQSRQKSRSRHGFRWSRELEEATSSPADVDNQRICRRGNMRASLKLGLQQWPRCKRLRNSFDAPNEGLPNLQEEPGTYALSKSSLATLSRISAHETELA